MIIEYMHGGAPGRAEVVSLEGRFFVQTEQGSGEGGNVLIVRTRLHRITVTEREVRMVLGGIRDINKHGGWSFLSDEANAPAKETDATLQAERIAELERALSEETEACAKVAESLPDQRGNSPEHLVGMRIAAAIRARAALASAQSSTTGASDE